MNLGSDFDYSTNTITIPEGKLSSLTIISTKLLSAIKNAVAVVNAGEIDGVAISHKRSGIFLKVTKSDLKPEQHVKQLVSDVLTQLKSPSPKDFENFNKKLAADVQNKIKLDGESLEIRTNGVGYTRPCTSRDNKAGMER
ncbi:MAG: hypothetical protein ABL867_10385 [Rickettsiales bacterium]